MNRNPWLASQAILKVSAIFPTESTGPLYIARFRAVGIWCGVRSAWGKADYAVLCARQAKRSGRSSTEGSGVWL
jgi:hypothetical protein